MDDNSGKRLKQRRLRQKMTMEKLAEEVGYTSSSKKTIIYQIESGKAEMQLSRVSSYASALETNIYYLLGLSDMEDLTDEQILQLIREKFDTKTPE